MIDTVHPMIRLNLRSVTPVYPPACASPAPHESPHALMIRLDREWLQRVESGPAAIARKGRKAATHAPFVAPRFPFQIRHAPPMDMKARSPIT